MKKLARKLTSLLLAALCSGSILLCACNKAEQTSDTSDEAGFVPPSAASTETSEITAATTLNNADTTFYEKVTLDGVNEHHYISTNYCYLESEKYVLLIDKDIELPGDFAVIMDAIIDEIENQLGVSAMPEDMEYPPVSDLSIYYNGFNPWKDWNIGSKIPIFIMCDRQPEGWISCATAYDVTIVSYGLFSDELWNSIPEFRDNPWRRGDYLDYTEMIHEVTHAITQRNCNMSKIMTEGIANYMEVAVVDALADKYPPIAEIKAKKDLFDYDVPEAVNASNAEAVFVSDYSDVSHADRGAEYTYGKYLFEYLHEQKGTEFFKAINEKLRAADIDYRYDEYDEAAMQKYAGVIKEIYGDDVFTKFGDWCVKNNHLQKTSE